MCLCLKCEVMIMIMKGIRKLCSLTRQVCEDYYSPHYVQIFYNYKTGELWGKDYYDIGHNSFSRYDDPYIISCGNVYSPKTMYEIAELVKQTCNERNIPVEDIQKKVEVLK